MKSNENLHSPQMVYSLPFISNEGLSEILMATHDWQIATPVFEDGAVDALMSEIDKHQGVVGQTAGPTPR
jgi:hypothetical protein